MDPTTLALLLANLRSAQRHAPISGTTTIIGDTGWNPGQLTVIAIDPYPQGIHIECLEGYLIFTEVTAGMEEQITAVVGPDVVHGARLHVSGTVQACSIALSATIIGRPVTVEITPRPCHTYPPEVQGGPAPVPALERLSHCISAVITDGGLRGGVIVNGRDIGRAGDYYEISVTGCRIDGGALVITTERPGWRAALVEEAWVSVERGWGYNHWGFDGYRRSTSMGISAMDLEGLYFDVQGGSGLPVVGLPYLLIHGW